MASFGRTGVVFNQNAKILGLEDNFYRWRTCDTNLNNQNPASQYQRLKLIQNTVRVYSSLYTANKGALEAFKKPSLLHYGVCWNQMSDRPVPSVQRATVPTGFYTSIQNRKHTSVTSSRPGCQTPGGVGCDIKHNSYDRYLNRLKGRGPFRRGPIPPTFGAPIPYNPAFPIKGGKTVKTNIVSGCYCPITSRVVNLKEDQLIYNDPSFQAEPIVDYVFSVGDYVYAIQTGNNFYTRAKIIEIDSNDIYHVQFDNGTTQIILNKGELLIYFPCNCDVILDGVLYKSGFLPGVNNIVGENCIYPILDYEKSIN
jgi:hypothetical protein